MRWEVVLSAIRDRCILLVIFQNPWIDGVNTGSKSRDYNPTLKTRLKRILTCHTCGNCCLFSMLARLLFLQLRRLIVLKSGCGVSVYIEPW